MTFHLCPIMSCHLIMREGGLYSTCTPGVGILGFSLQWTCHLSCFVPVVILVATGYHAKNVLWQFPKTLCPVLHSDLVRFARPRHLLRRGGLPGGAGHCSRVPAALDQERDWPGLGGAVEHLWGKRICLLRALYSSDTSKAEINIL